MRRLHFEGAVVGPQIDRIGDAGASSFVNHLGRLWTSNIELLVGILLPVGEQQRKFLEETIVRISEGGDSLGARVSVEATLHLNGANEFLPLFEVVGIGILCQEHVSFAKSQALGQIGGLSKHTTSDLRFLISAFSSSAPPKCPKSPMLGKMSQPSAVNRCRSNVRNDDFTASVETTQLAID